MSEKIKVNFVKVKDPSDFDPIAIIHAYCEAKEKTDENPFLFSCPYCGGQAKGGYCEGNGHFRIVCDCGVKLMA